MPSLTVYLDTAQWIDLAEGRLDRNAFEQAVKTNRITPVLSFVHAVEIAIQELDSRTRVARYIEEVAQWGNLLWTRFLPGVTASEICTAFARWLGLMPEPICVFREAFTESMEGHLYLDDWITLRTTPFHQQIELLTRVAELERHKEVRETVVSEHLRRKESGEHLPSRLDRIKQICWGVLKRGFETSAGIVIDVGPRQVEQFVQQLDLDMCPALHLWIAFQEGKALTQGGEEPSDVEDLNHLVGLAYCDVAFADKRTCEALRKAKVRKLPKRNSEFLQWLKSLTNTC
jgi:hypothetical protein